MKTISKSNKVAQRRIDNMDAIKKLACCEDREESESYREPLCIDTFVQKKIFLSYGGPSDGFTLIQPRRKRK